MLAFIKSEATETRWFPF